MKRRKKTLTKAVCAALFLGAVLSPVTPGAPLYALAEEEEGEKALEYLSSAEKLIAADPALNQITIGLMLDKAEGALPAGHPAIFALEDIRTNLEQGMEKSSVCRQLLLS